MGWLSLAGIPYTLAKRYYLPMRYILYPCSTLATKVPMTIFGSNNETVAGTLLGIHWVMVSFLQGLFLQGLLRKIKLCLDFMMTSVRYYENSRLSLIWMGLSHV